MNTLTTPMCQPLNWSSDTTCRENQLQTQATLVGLSETMATDQLMAWGPGTVMPRCPYYQPHRLYVLLSGLTEVGEHPEEGRYLDQRVT